MATTSICVLFLFITIHRFMGNPAEFVISPTPQDDVVYVSPYCPYVTCNSNVSVSWEVNSLLLNSGKLLTLTRPAHGEAALLFATVDGSINGSYTCKATVSDNTVKSVIRIEAAQPITFINCSDLDLVVHNAEEDRVICTVNSYPRPRIRVYRDTLPLTYRLWIEDNQVMLFGVSDHRLDGKIKVAVSVEELGWDESKEIRFRVYSPEQQISYVNRAVIFSSFLSIFILFSILYVVYGRALWLHSQSK